MPISIKIYQRLILWENVILKYQNFDILEIKIFELVWNVN